MHSPFAPSPLARQLAAWMPAEAGAPAADVAERLSGWFGPLEAIQLQALHQDLAATPAARAAAQPTARQAQALADDVQRVRGTLARAIAQDPLALAGLKPGDADAAGYAPWQQRHLELQRQMGQLVDAVRDHARQAVARASARLQPLATLDAAFEQLLAAREQALLPATLRLLERRHHALRSAHRKACEAADLPDDSATWLQPGGWLATFADDWRQALLAELDLRLEPVQGLLDALRTDSGSPP